MTCKTPLIGRAIFSLFLAFPHLIHAQDAQPSVAPEPGVSETLSKASCKNLVGGWVNQMGSRMRIKSVNTNTGAVSGDYQTATGAAGWFPLVGWTNSVAPSPGQDNAKIFSFSVRWGKYGSVTSWTGVCRGNDDLRTVWNLGQPVSQFEWDHVLTGADNFKPL